jgi:hypothetical protein
MEEPLDDNTQIEDGTCSGDIVPSLIKDVEAWYVLGGTGTQIMKLLSACEAGAELLYPNEKFNITFPLRRALYCMPTFCEAVQACIESNPNIINIIINLGGGKGEAGKEGVLPPVPEINPVTGETCDLDALFAYSTQVVDWVNDTITDIFERIEAATNSLELLNETLEMIPGFGWLAAPLDVANVLQEQLAENYAAEFTSAIRDELRCGLFCRLKQTCIVDWRTLYEYFGEIAGQQVLEIDVEDIGEYFTTGIFSGSEIVYGSYWLVLGMLSFAGDVLGTNYDKFSKISASFLNDEDPDWELICDCVSPEREPALATNACFLESQAGTLITNVGVNRWRVYTTQRPGLDIAAAIKDKYGRVFNISNVTFSSSYAAYGCVLANGDCRIRLELPTAQPILSFIYTWAENKPQQWIEFDMTPA